MGGVEEDEDTKDAYQSGTDDVDVLHSLEQRILERGIDRSANSSHGKDKLNEDYRESG